MKGRRRNTESKYGGVWKQRDRKRGRAGDLHIGECLRIAVECWVHETNSGFSSSHALFIDLTPC